MGALVFAFVFDIVFETFYNGHDALTFGAYIEQAKIVHSNFS